MRTTTLQRQCFCMQKWPFCVQRSPLCIPLAKHLQFLNYSCVKSAK